MTIGPLAFGRLRQRDEKGRLRKIDGIGVLAEIGERGGAHAFKIAAEGRKREIDRKDLVFRIALFELDGAHHLEQLCADAARARLQQSRGLHGERGRSGNNMPGTHILQRRAEDGGGIDTEMGIEALVFIGLEEFEIARVHIARIGLEPPIAGIGEKRAQEHAVPVHHLGRDMRVARHVRRVRDIRGGKRKHGAERCKGDRDEAMRRKHHFALLPHSRWGRGPG